MNPTSDKRVIYTSEAFSVYRDSVVQGKFTAKAISRTEIVSDYISATVLNKSPEVTCKFSINGADNSAPPGKDNVIICAGRSGDYETPVIKFGEQYVDSTKVSGNEYL